MNMKKLNQSGFGMLGFMIAIFAIGLALAGMSETISNMFRSQISVAASAQVDMLVDQMQTAMSNEAVCTAALTGTNPNAGPISMTMNMSGTDRTFQENTTLMPGIDLIQFRISSAPVTNLAGLPLPTLNGGTMIPGRAKITMQIKRTTEGIFVPVSRPREMWINTVMDLAGTQIMGCAAETPAAQACMLQGGTWNPLAPDGQRCISDQNCQFAGSFTNLVAGVLPPGGFLNSYTGGASCPAGGFNAKQTGQVVTAVSCGKRCVHNKFTPVFSCLRCAQNGQTAAAFSGTYIDPAMQALIDQSLAEADAQGDTGTSGSSAFQANQTLGHTRGCSPSSTPCGSLNGTACNVTTWVPSTVRSTVCAGVTYTYTCNCTNP